MAVASIVQSLTEIMGVEGVPSQLIDRLTPKFTTLLEDFASRLDTQQTQLKEQEERCDDLVKRVVSLEKQVKRQVINEKKRDVALVRNSIIVRTNKGDKDIRTFLSNCIELGGWGSKPPANQLALVELVPPPGKERTSKVFRVQLLEGQKSALFKGLQKCDIGPNSQIRVDNDTPFFAQNAKRSLEQLSYSLRQKFAKSDKLRTKIVLSNLRLRLRCRDASAKDPKDWWSPDDARAVKYFTTTNVIFRPDQMPAVIPTCMEYYKEIMDDQE